MSVDDQTSGERWLDMTNAAYDKVTGFLLQVAEPERVAVEQGTAYLKLGGGCQGCAMATVTLSQGIERAIIQAVAEITSVVDVTDHQSGTNPYFEAAKK